MKTRNEILITYDAVKTIIREARRYPVETGGILVGSLAGQIAIVASGGSGVNSVHHEVQYTSDATQDEKCLAEARRKFDDKPVVVGWWHKHPSGMDMPSPGDCVQARKLAEEYNDGKPILMGIVNRYESKRHAKTSLKFYSLDSGGRLIKYAWKLVKSDDKNLLSVINAMPGRPEIDNDEFWRDENFQFYRNPVGRQRIQNEIRQLKDAGWNVVTTREKSSCVLTMEVTDGKLKIRFKFPPEYPLNPPAVSIIGDGNYSPNYWNSLSNLLHIVSKIKEYHYGCHLIKQLHDIF